MAAGYFWLLILITGDLTMNLQAVILDVDGTLVLSNDAHAKAWVESFSAYGI